MTTAEHEAALADARRRGLPAIRGEHIGTGTGGYHYYPDRDQVRARLDAEYLELVAEADEALDGYGYHHLLIR